MNYHMAHIYESALKGAAGTFAPVMGVILSNMSEIEQWLRVLSLTGGLIVCGLTIRSFIKNWDK